MDLHHHDLAKGENAELLRRAFRSGFTINVSTESVAADAAIATQDCLPRSRCPALRSVQPGAPRPGNLHGLP